MSTPQVRGRRILLALLTVASVCLPMGLNAPADDQLSGLCGTFDLSGVIALLEIRMRLGSLFDMVAQSILMSVAMMLPLALLAIADVDRHAPPRRWPATGSLVTAYLFCWLLVGIIMVPVSLVGSIVATEPSALVIAVIAAVAWHSTATAREARSRCRRPDRYPRGRLPPVAEGGSAGLRLGRDCVLACWPWMVLPIFAMGFHHVAMSVVALLLLSQRACVDLPDKEPLLINVTAVA